MVSEWNDTNNIGIEVVFYVKCYIQLTSLNSKVSVYSHGRTENRIVLFDIVHSLNFRHSLEAGLQVQRHCEDYPRGLGYATDLKMLII